MTEEGKPKSKVMIGCLVLVGVIVVLAVIGLFAGGDDAPEQVASEAEPPVSVTAQELAAAYDANEAAAQQTYANKRLLVSGTVAAIELDFMDNPVVQLATSNEFVNAGANLTEESQAKAANLSKGQEITLLCAGVGEVIGSPQLRDCEIQ